MSEKKLQAPFVYFGGKASIAHIVWSALSQPKHYLEPFFGSGAVLLARPNYDPTQHIETVCDADGHICNVWRAIKANPEAVAELCDWPVNHADLVARRKVLNERNGELLKALTADPDYYDTRLAGYWVWAASCWIGHGLTRKDAIPHLADSGMGVYKLSKRPHLTNSGVGVHKLSKIPHLGNSGRGVHKLSQRHGVYDWLNQLSARLRHVRVVCGDWTRICGGNWQTLKGGWTCGVFMDPPYAHSTGRDKDLYAAELDCTAAVRKWCLERGKNELYRIVLAGYEGEHNELEAAGWEKITWKAGGGYGNQSSSKNPNRHRERLWLSPHCAKGQQELFTTANTREDNDQ